jgi:hypothetical protein
MGDPPPRRHRGWKILGFIALFLIASLALIWVWAGYAAGRRYAALQVKVKAMVAELQARDGRRPVLRGEAQLGNSREDYSKVVADLVNVSGDTLWALAARLPEADPLRGAVILTEHRAVLDHLRQGAGRDSSYLFDWDRFMRGSMRDRSNAWNDLLNHDLCYFVQVKARDLLREGKPREAVEILLDLCQFGRDVAADGPSSREGVGYFYLGLGLYEFAEGLASGSMGSVVLQEIDRSLGVLDRSFPSHEQALMKEALTRAIYGLPGGESGHLWDRLLALDSMEREFEWAARAARAETRPWAEAKQVALGIGDEAGRVWNPLLRYRGPALVWSETFHRQCRARLRILRTAAHWRDTGTVLDLDDPFGGKLKRAQSGDRLRIWSNGPDGVDDGGAGDWDKYGKDIVLEIGK